MKNFTNFKSWEEMLNYVAEGKDIYYHPPLDRFPYKVNIIKKFKNGKLRIKAEASSFGGFTIDNGHLNRLYYRNSI